MVNFSFFQNGLIHTGLESTGMERSNGLPTTTKVEEPLGTYVNGSDAKIYWTNSYASIIGIMLNLESNKRPDISFAVHQCAQFTHNTNASHETAVKRIYWYLQGTKNNGLVLNPSKKLVVDCYADADFSGPWGNENTQEPICDRSRTVFVVTFSNCPLLLVSALQTDISISKIHYEYVVLYHSVRAPLPLKILMKEVIDNLVIDSEKLNFVSRSTVYEDNDGAIVVATSTRITPTSNHIATRYH